MRMCRRNIGVGADGILYGPLTEHGKIYVKIFKPDGSEAERSGNGVRIFAKYLLDEGYIKRKSFVLTTKAGDVTIEFLSEDGSRMRVNMGQARFAGAPLPRIKKRDGSLVTDEIVNEPLIFHDSLYNATCDSMGNPNCVIMMEEVNDNTAKALGPYVENAPYFPQRINMQLCHVIDKGHIQVEIYERGAGYTLASGTGACAAAAAAYRMGLTGADVRVEMPGGDLRVEIADDMTVYLTGEVEKIASIEVAENFFA